MKIETLRTTLFFHSGSFLLNLVRVQPWIAVCSLSCFQLTLKIFFIIQMSIKSEDMNYCALFKYPLFNLLFQTFYASAMFYCLLQVCLDCLSFFFSFSATVTNAKKCQQKLLLVVFPPAD